MFRKIDNYIHKNRNNHGILPEVKRMLRDRINYIEVLMVINNLADLMVPEKRNEFLKLMDEKLPTFENKEQIQDIINEFIRKDGCPNFAVNMNGIGGVTF